MALDNAGDIAAGRVRRDRLELLVGLGAVLLLAILVVLALVGRGHPEDGGYPLHAAFSHIDGLGVGSDVRLAGVTVGHVRSMAVDPRSFQADIVFSVAPDIKLPTDSGAVITSDSLLGGKYVALTPGGETDMLKPGGTIGETQGAISLEQLLSKFIFSVTDSLQRKAAPSTTVAPAPAQALSPGPSLAPVSAPVPARAPAPASSPASVPASSSAHSSVPAPASGSASTPQASAPRGVVEAQPSVPSARDPASSDPASALAPFLQESVTGSSVGDLSGQVEMPGLPSGEGASAQ